MKVLRVAQLTTDVREHLKRYSSPEPSFGTPVEALVDGFRAVDGVEVHLISCVQEHVPASHQLAPRIDCHALHVPRLGWLKTGYQGCVRAVRRKLRELNPDIVHGQGTERDCALSAVLSGFPNVVTIHGNMRGVARWGRARPFSFHWITARLEAFTLPRTDGVLCNSAYTEQEVRPLARRVWRVANPVRSAFFQTPPPERRRGVPVLLNIGVIGRMKRQLELLRLAAKLHAEGLRFELRFVGKAFSGPVVQTFLREMAEAEAAGFARYLGSLGTDELIAGMDAADALVHVSSEESFGLVVAESLARGLAFFGFAVGGVPDVAQGVPGATLVQADDWSALGRGITAWIRAGAPSTPGAPERMRQRYHPEVIARRHVEIYREVLASAQSSANPSRHPQRGW